MQTELMVTDLSHNLNDQELNLLAKGPKFGLLDGVDNNTIDDFQASFYRLANSLQWREYHERTQATQQSRTQSNACARARMALALGKLNFSCVVIGLTCMPTKPEPLNLGVPVVNFPRANAILARAQALLWVRDWLHNRPQSKPTQKAIISGNPKAALNLNKLLRGFITTISE